MENGASHPEHAFAGLDPPAVCRLPHGDGRTVTVRKPSLPDADQAQIFGMLGGDWKTMCPATKTERKPATIL